ncbi:hypothetical protein LTR66_003804 [Elasticomyces elasticus]|nr:hypothetical protein LTR66_003804 [Elasticomyces elasticus]
MYGSSGRVRILSSSHRMRHNILHQSTWRDIDEKSKYLALKDFCGSTTKTISFDSKMAGQTPTIDRLLNLVADSPSAVLSHLSSNPQLASRKDSHGYSLLHAATSYDHPELLRTLVNTHHVDVNLTDEDGETPLFAAENVNIARCLVEELGANVEARNEQRQTAEEKLTEEGEYPLVAAYLREAAAGHGGGAASVVAQTGGANDATAALNGTNGDTNGVHPPPPLPQGVHINVETIEEPGEEGAPDPEFRRRIEELAAREDFQTEEGQTELRNLVRDAISGLAPDASGREAKRR